MKQLAKICIFGSLDRDAEDNGDKNMNSLYFTYETCDSLKPFSLFSWTEPEVGTHSPVKWITKKGSWHQL